MLSKMMVDCKVLLESRMAHIFVIFNFPTVCLSMFGTHTEAQIRVMFFSFSCAALWECISLNKQINS